MEGGWKGEGNLQSQNSSTKGGRKRMDRRQTGVVSKDQIQHFQHSNVC